MRKIIISIIIFFSFYFTYSQDLSKIRLSVKKLDFNTKLSEISCNYSDGKLLYFQNGKAMRSNSQFYDLFMLDSVNLNNKYGNKNKISLTEQLTVITSYHEGPCFVDERSNKIYVTINSLDKKGIKRAKKLNTVNENRLRLLEGDFKDGIISNLKEFKYNNEVYSVGHATYSHSTKRLYFVSTMPGSIGGPDIFYCSKKADGSWDTPVNLGKRINSSKSELYPFVKNGILFFTSNGQRKQKGRDLDLYFIKESEISLKFPTEFSDANTNYDDYSICFNDNESKFEGFFTSNRNNIFAGDDDVYGFTISNIKEEKMYDLIVKFTNNEIFFNSGYSTLMDENGELINTVGAKKDEFVFKNLERGKKYKLAYNNEEISRLFQLPINNYSGYVTEIFNIESDGIFSDTLLVDNINLLLNNPIDTVKKDELLITDKGILNSAIAKEKAPEIKVNEVIKFDRKEKFENIYFDFDSYIITDESQILLDKIIKYANKNKAKYIIMNAYTDARGDNEYNQELSDKRALSARGYLIDKGISASKIKYKGFGENNLVSKCGDGIKCSDKEHSKNRRIEFTIAY